MSSFMHNYAGICGVYERIRQWPVTDIGGRPLVNESSRNKKKRIDFKIWTAVSRGEKYKIGAAVQTLEIIGFTLFRDDSFTRGTSNKRRFIYKS